MTNKTDKNSKETRSRAQSKIDERTSTDTKPKRASVYEQITERIVDLLARGTIPWHKPWQIQTGLPRNLVSKKAYRGINVFLLHAMSYESRFWLTYRQAQELGGNVRKGEKACPVVFWKKARRFSHKWTGAESSILAGLIFTSSGRELGLIWTGMGSKFLEQYQMAVSDLRPSLPTLNRSAHR